ncbi:MAG TPA: PAS domain-containing protein, partial [Prolixibacteraceae bacterium]|nr:PAS domain-containing protein [Prolixibacteraceae bacterium]
MDYKLPDMNGKELVQQLIKKHGFTPNFITLTGYRDEKIAAEMMKMGSHKYMVKEPRFLDVLPEVLNHVCQHVTNELHLAKTEIELQKNLELLKKTGEMARVGGWEIILETNQVFWSDTTKKIHEVPEDYSPTMEVAVDFFHGESKLHLKNAINKAVQEKTGYDLELQFVTAKGNKLWVHTIGKPVIENGKCVAIRGTFQDITRRKEAEKDLKIKNAKLKRTEKIAHVGSWEWDILSDTVTWSDQLFNIFNLDPKEGAPSYADHSKIYTPESLKLLNKAVKKTIDSGQSYKIDLEIVRGDGKNSICTAIGRAKKDKNGKVVKLFGSFQDITERKRAEEELIKSEKKLQLVVDNSPFPVAVVDEKDQNILHWSKSALEMFGHDPKTSEEWYKLAYPN